MIYNLVAVFIHKKYTCIIHLIDDVERQRSMQTHHQYLYGWYASGIEMFQMRRSILIMA